MKFPLALFLLAASAALAQPAGPAATPVATPPAATPPPAADVPPGSFPGIRIVMTAEEFAKAGLNGLTDEQLDIINLAVARHYDRTVAKAATQQAQEISQQTIAEEHEKSWLSRVGLPDISKTQEWKSQPSVKAKCTGWVTGNSFRLDNDQVWVGVEPIRMELTGHDIEIQPRPNGAFDLVVDGKNTTYRIQRVK